MINVNHKNINHSKLPNKLALLKLPTPVQLLRQNVCRLAEVMIVYFLVGSLFGGGDGGCEMFLFFLEGEAQINNFYPSIFVYF